VSITEERALPGRRAIVHLADGTSFQVRITNREYVRWDQTAPRKKWGNAADVPFLASTFLAWAAARRDDLTELTFEQFQDTCEEVENLEEDDSDVARPTRTAPEAASS
jgi:hypothetical protein